MTGLSMRGRRGRDGGERIPEESSWRKVSSRAVAAVSFSVAWFFKAFLGIAAEERVHLYGEEISVDATEKTPEELDGLDDDEEYLDISGDGGDTSPGNVTELSPAGASSVMGKICLCKSGTPRRWRLGFFPERWQ